MVLLRPVLYNGVYLFLQICSACLKCKSCDSNRVNKFVGSLPFCRPCFKLRQKGNYCPLCQACYKDNDFDSKVPLYKPYFCLIVTNI